MSTITNMIKDLFQNAMESTPQGFVGVGLIFIYFVIILSAATWRIKKGDHMKEH